MTRPTLVSSTLPGDGQGSSARRHGALVGGRRIAGRVHATDSKPPSQNATFSVQPAVLPERNPQIVFKMLSDGAVLYSPSDETYFGLNEVGVEIWNLLPPTSHSFEELCASLQQLHPDVDIDTVRTDVAELLDHLREFDLIRNWRTPAPPSSSA
ncbi:MAG: PqqD family protein [Gemmatimonadota bacterium]|nr:PqqD family protein [Gemmatimonadota bacterium]